MGPGDTGRLSLVKCHGYVQDLARYNCLRATVAPAEGRYQVSLQAMMPRRRIKSTHFNYVQQFFLRGVHSELRACGSHTNKQTTNNLQVKKEEGVGCPRHCRDFGPTCLWPELSLAFLSSNCRACVRARACSECVCLQK